MPNDIPPLRPTQFEGDSIGRLSKSVNMSRGDVTLAKTLISLPGRPDDTTLAISVTLQYQSNVSQDAVLWNLDAPTSILGLGWTLPLSYIALVPSASLAPAGLSYVMSVDGVENALIEDDLPWGRGALDQTQFNDLAAGAVSASVIAAFATQSLELSTQAEVSSAASGGWLISDPATQRLFQVQATSNGGDIYDGGISYQLQDFQFLASHLLQRV